MTRTEKPWAMEALWDDRTRFDDEYPSPEWQGDVLRKREEAVREGIDEFIPWEDAQRILRENTIKADGLEYLFRPGAQNPERESL